MSFVLNALFAQFYCRVLFSFFFWLFVLYASVSRCHYLFPSQAQFVFEFHQRVIVAHISVYVHDDDARDEDSYLTFHVFFPQLSATLNHCALNGDTCVCVNVLGVR